MSQQQKKTNKVNIDPADQGTPTGLFAKILSTIFENIDGALPVKVLDHDRDAHTVDVTHCILKENENGQVVERGTLTDIHVFNMGAGGWVMDFYIPPGTKGWIFAADRDTSLFYNRLIKSSQTQAESTPLQMVFLFLMFSPVTVLQTMKKAHL